MMASKPTIHNPVKQERFCYLQSFNNYIEANIVLKMLQDAGINCHLEDEHLNTIVNLTSGMRLMVYESQVERARQLLADAEAAFIATLSCSRCGQQQLQMKLVQVDVKPQFGGIFSFLSKLLSGVDNRVTMKHYQCKHCGMEYEELPIAT